MAYIDELRPLDANAVLQSYRVGAADAEQEAQRNLLKEVGRVSAEQGMGAGAKTALAGGNVDLGMKLKNMDTEQQLKVFDFLGRGAIAADTPEKWGQYIGVLSKTFGPESIRGFEDFRSRESAIILSKSAFDAAQAKAAGDRFSSSISSAFGGQPAAGGPPSASSDPRGIRNNNPLNIESGKFTEGQAGYQGSDGRFAKFASLDQGVAAADALLANYGRQGINTVAGVIGKWAPSSENNTAAYAASVARALGVDPNAPINMADPAVRQRMIGAMAQVENGRPLPQATPQPVQMAGGVPSRQSIPALLRAIADPNLPQGQKQAAIEMLKVAMDEAKLPTDVKEYIFAQSNPGYKQYQIDLKTASATKVTQNNKVEDSYDSERGKSRAKRADEFITAGDKAFATLGTLQIMKQATEDPAFYSGVGAERFALPLKQAIVALGGDPKGAASMEVFRSQANKAVLDSMGGSLGTGFSNADRDFVVSQVPGLGNTREGNRVLISIAEKVERRKIEVARLAQEYEQEKGRLDSGFERILTQFRERNPLFTPQERQEIQIMTASPEAIQRELERRK